VRILRHLLSRIENPETGEIPDPAFHVPIPPQRAEQARQAAQTLGPGLIRDFPLLEGVQPEADSVADLMIQSSWKPAFSVIGLEGLPSIEQAGNVIVPSVKAKLSLRVPPGVEAGAAGRRMQELLERDPPRGAHVNVEAGGMPGWEAPPLAPWLEAAWNAASREFYGQEPRYLGGGGTIPLLQMIGSRFPRSQFLTTGVLGPHSNAHGPNEFLHVPYATRLTAALVRVLEAHGSRPG
jgi:acetylornithine deacetylase/succinyl-diaminopimelate desuccinylase-like protein